MMKLKRIITAVAVALSTSPAFTKQLPIAKPFDPVRSVNRR
jgi:hypothetical protein